jgi:hypothetical protein
MLRFRSQHLVALLRQGVVVESIAFDKFYGSEASTKSILVGNNRGQIFETVLEAAATKDRSLHLVSIFLSRCACLDCPGGRAAAVT